MLPQLTETQWLALLAGFVGFHLILGMLSFRWHPAWLLTAAFLVLAQFTRATDLPFAYALKYARTYICGLMALIAVWSIWFRGLRGAPLVLVVFALFYTLTGLYSDHVLFALFYKGQFLALVITGTLIAVGLRSLSDVHRLLTLFLAAFAVFEAVVLLDAMTAPGQLVGLGRLSPLGMNPNGVGTAGALALPVCLYLYTTPISKLMRIVALATGIMGVMMVLLSGSRGALVAAVIGVFVVLFPMVRRPGYLAVLSLTLIVLVGGLFTFISESEAVQRLGGSWDLMKARASVWSDAWAFIKQGGLFGHGWVSQSFGANARTSTRNLHSMYLQVLGSSGVPGMLLMVTAYVMIATSMIKAWRITAHNPTYRLAVFLGAAYTLQIMAIGVAESGPLYGSARHALLMAFGIGLIHQAPRILARDFALAQQYAGLTEMTAPSPMFQPHVQPSSSA